MALAGSQQPRAQDPAPVRRCGTEGRFGPQGREGRDGDRSRGGDGNDNEDGNGHEDRDVGDSGNVDESGGEDGGERELGTYEVIVKVGRKTRKREWRERVTSSRIRKTRRPSETVASRGGPEPRDGMLET